MRRKTISVLIALAIAMTSSSVFAYDNNSISKNHDEELKPIFSDIPDKDDLKLINKNKLPAPEAWMISADGKKTSVKIVEKEKKNGEISADFVSGYIQYDWVRYDPKYSSTDQYKHFVNSLSLKNTTTQTIPLKYTQTNSKTNTWTVTGKVEVEAKFKVAVLADLKGKFGLDITDSWYTGSSTTVEFTMNVAPGKTGKISKYLAGKQSSGAGVWRAHHILSGADLGYYYETGGAWGIDPDVVNYIASEYY